MRPHLHDGKKVDWEEYRWDQDLDRWVGPYRDEAPAMAIRPGHDEDERPGKHQGLLD